ncbi:large-conductance mechanosensitive channel [Pochonia chlamydosporia 170]|uniref:Large-conductance mechanosensitive channel n=1 Tax=Pochonia chlamydosporia 170 TaxID=1380566 RepID=A0A179FCB8_METCM|nr:large-conductance mechanosensitive channel [Pochonia chlamydosporia 170]OAQ63134.1 large-conductance mechanosensitive channel [Pochonia chlamydosporia 170]
MPSDVENGNSETDSLLNRGRHRMKRFFDGFVDFAFQGNILQIAFGLMYSPLSPITIPRTGPNKRSIANIFTDLIKSFVSAILMPPLAIIFPVNKNIEEKFAVLRYGDNYNTTTGYNTLRQALDDGAVVMAYGSFIYQVVSFVMVGFALYGLAHVYTLVSHDPIIKYTKKCKYCRKRINEKCLRCINCTSWQDGREERNC